jgi:hypothetical protein
MLENRLIQPGYWFMLIAKTINQNLAIISPCIPGLHLTLTGGWRSPEMSIRRKIIASGNSPQLVVNNQQHH